MLDLSTLHLPWRFWDAATADEAWSDVPVSYEIEHGRLMWIPDDVDATIAGYPGDIPSEIVAVMRFARSHVCDFVMFDGDAPLCDDLPEYDQPDAFEGYAERGDAAAKDPT